jgi:hypothetical protein
VITREGISADNQATMSEFLGSAADTARSRDRLG